MIDLGKSQDIQQALELELTKSRENVYSMTSESPTNNVPYEEKSNNTVTFEDEKVKALTRHIEELRVEVSDSRYAHEMKSKELSHALKNKKDIESIKARQELAKLEQNLKENARSLDDFRHSLNRKPSVSKASYLMLQDSTTNNISYFLKYLIIGLLFFICSHVYSLNYSYDLFIKTAQNTSSKSQLALSNKHRVNFNFKIPILEHLSSQQQYDMIPKDISIHGENKNHIQKLFGGILSKLLAFKSFIKSIFLRLLNTFVNKKSQ